MSDDSQVFWTVATVEVRPDMIDQVIECFDFVVKGTQENEPDTLIYRYFRSEEGDGNTFIWVGKYTNREVYMAHRGSNHVTEWVKKWPNKDRIKADFFVNKFVFHHMNPEIGARGFERS